MSMLRLWRAATATVSGIVTTAAQTFAGAKTFNGLIDASSTSGGVKVETARSGSVSDSQNVYSGTYTPTITNLSGTSSITAQQAQFVRVGKCVVVSGRMVAGFSATTDCNFTISLPIARTSAFTSSAGIGAAGVASYNRGGGGGSLVWQIVGTNASTTTVNAFAYVSSALTADAVCYTFTYTLD